MSVTVVTLDMIETLYGVGYRPETRGIVTPVASRAGQALHGFGGRSREV